MIKDLEVNYIRRIFVIQTVNIVSSLLSKYSEHSHMLTKKITNICFKNH